MPAQAAKLLTKYCEDNASLGLSPQDWGAIVLAIAQICCCVVVQQVT